MIESNYFLDHKFKDVSKYDNSLPTIVFLSSPAFNTVERPFPKKLCFINVIRNHSIDLHTSLITPFQSPNCLLFYSISKFWTKISPGPLDVTFPW